MSSYLRNRLRRRNSNLYERTLDVLRGGYEAIIVAPEPVKFIASTIYSLRVAKLSAVADAHQKVRRTADFTRRYPLPLRGRAANANLLSAVCGWDPDYNEGSQIAWLPCRVTISGQPMVARLPRRCRLVRGSSSLWWLEVVAGSDILDEIRFYFQLALRFWEINSSQESGKTQNGREGD